MNRAPIPFHVETSGRGTRDVVLLHGFGTSGHTWNGWLPRLSEVSRVHVVDLKGFGAAPKPDDGRYSPLDQATALVDWIRRGDLRRVILVGHSLGGGVALLTALKLNGSEPDRIAGLALLAGIAYPQPVSRYLRLLGRPRLGPLLLRLLPKRPLMRVALRMAYHPSHPVSESRVDAYTTPLRTVAGRRALSRSASSLWAPEMAEVIQSYDRISVPCLLIWGDTDRVVPLWVGKRLASEIPRARLEILEKCGHMPQEEDPDASLDHLLGFMDQEGLS